MDIKINHYVLIAILGSMSSLISCRNLANNKSLQSNGDTTSISQQQMLKDYFLCSCIDYGFKDDSLFFKDASKGVYIELLDYSYEDILRIKQLAKQKNVEIQSLKGETSSDLKSEKAIFINCIDYYKSKELDMLIKSMKLKK